MSDKRPVAMDGGEELFDIDVEPTTATMAFEILLALIRTDSGGTKESKVAAAWEYADLMREEMEMEGRQ